MNIEHIQPRKLDGNHTADNLCLACAQCNSYKGDAVLAVDPQNDQEASLFNPRLQQWPDHFRWDESQSYIIGMTDIGRATVEKLKMNNPKQVASRPLWIALGLYPPKL